MIILTQEICNPQKKTLLTAEEIIHNINIHYNCEIAKLIEENHIEINIEKLTDDPCIRDIKIIV